MNLHILYATYHLSFISNKYNNVYICKKVEFNYDKNVLFMNIE